MRKSLFIFSTSVLLLIFIPKTSYAWGVGSVTGAMKRVVDSEKISDSMTVMFPFGGKIISTGTACKIRFWVWTNTPFGTFPCPNCGFIPVAGTVIDVGEPGIPASQVFTFPGITKIYPNKNEDKVEVWTLGIALKPFLVQRIINKINRTLSRIRVPVPSGWLDHFHLVCPDGGIIRQIGTSIEENNEE